MQIEIEKIWRSFDVFFWYRTSSLLIHFFQLFFHSIEKKEYFDLPAKIFAGKTKEDSDVEIIT